ncbi:Fungal hydrophobin domain containing protein [Tylopilus felleus]
MFARVFALLPLALLASASHLEARDTCSTGSINCCNSVQTYKSAQGYLTKHNIVLPVDLDVSALLGIECSGITAIGVSGTSCTAQTACCNGDTFNGLVTLGCSPINVSP